MGRISAKALLHLAFALAFAVPLLGGCSHQGASATGTATETTPAPVDATPAPTEAPAAEASAVEAQAAQLPSRDKSKPGIVDYSCNTDADCAIKDVGNCCGTYPACVNRDSPTFPDQVKAQCAEKGMMGVCGFPVLTGCQCVENRCEGVNDAPTGSGTRID